MGKAYLRELEEVQATLSWASMADVSCLSNYIGTLSDRNLQTVGSGGSYSVASYHALLHQYTFKKFSKSTTPLDFILNIPDSCTAISFLTAGGGNTDVLTSWKIAVENDFSHFFALVMRENSKILRISEKSSGAVFSYSPPAGKDGFLATNTIIASAVLLARAYMVHSTRQSIVFDGPNLKNLENVDDVLLQKRDWLVLSGGWAWPAAVDLESKCSEAALKHVLLSDYRSFGHGRHLWLDKHRNDCGIIAITTPDEIDLVKRTLRQIPENIPRLVISAHEPGPSGTIELFHCVLELVGCLGKIIGRDPGRPGVPSFGSKLYHLGPLGVKIKKHSSEETWIKRKAQAMGINQDRAEKLKPALKNFLSKLKKTTFSGIVLDFDGTLCDPHKRFTALASDIATELNRLLGGGIRIGVATGRGRSAIERLKEAVSSEFLHLVTVGYYNGTCLLDLCDPNSVQMPSVTNELDRVAKILASYDLGTIDVRPMQITLTPEASNLVRLTETVKVLLAGIPNVAISRSSHSIDVRIQGYNKLSVYNRLLTAGNILTIGDSGGPGGNDEDLLSAPYSLSCYEPTLSLDTGWHLAPPGRHFSSATQYYLSCVKINDYGAARFLLR